jgi:hypothetical protein
MKSIITLLFLTAFVVAPPPPKNAPNPQLIDIAMAETEKHVTKHAMTNLFDHLKQAQAHPENEAAIKASMQEKSKKWDTASKDVDWIRKNFGSSAGAS